MLLGQLGRLTHYTCRVCGAQFSNEAEVRAADEAAEAKRHKDDAECEKMLDNILSAAENHAHESEADHEVGDLRTALQLCWNELTYTQRKKVYAEIARDNDIAVWIGEADAS